MCGIAGIFGRRDDDQVAAMLARLGHRGPDDTHLVGGEGFTLGATRLAIIDVAGGRQPLASETGEVLACQNGEIYDYVELRADLSARGHVFATSTDTEVLVHGYEEHGPAVAELLVGMFAVAIWDRTAGQGVLIRDRVGKKPLYYHRCPDGSVAFASEIKALLALPTVGDETDPVAIDYFVSLKHVPCPRTIWARIRALPPSHRLVFRRGAPLRIERYANLDWSQQVDLDDEALAEAIRIRLTKAIDRRLRSDVPIGFFLSGGLDSSLVAAIAATRSSRPIHTFTLTYDAQGTTAAKEEDRRYARQVAERYGTIHVEESIAPGDLREDLPRIVAAFDEPMSGVISPFYLARRIACDVKVALSGDGADEVFGSYLSHRLAAALALDSNAARTSHDFQLDPTLLARSRGEPEWRWRSQLVTVPSDAKASLFSPEFLARLEAARAPGIDDYFRDLYSTARAPDLLNRTLEVEFRSQLPDQVLGFVDRLSMAHSLEVRSPYLDQDFVAFAATIPGRQKIAPDGTVKAALKRAARPFLPEELIVRAKEGFLMPINQWLVPLEPWIRAVLAPASVTRARVFSPVQVTARLDEFFAGQQRLGAQVFSLLVYQIWHDLYLEGGGIAARAAACTGHRQARALA